jgi:hypothetical protein
LRRFAVIAVILGLALGGAGCGELPDVTTVKDLRVLAVKCEPAGFLVNLDDPGGTKPGGATQADYTAQITALVADPLAPGGTLAISAVACPDILDTITAATGKATKTCSPPPTTPPAAGTPEFYLSTTTIVPSDMPLSVPPTPGMDYVWQPTLSYGLRTDQVGAFFTLTGADATLDKAIQYNRDFGVSAIVNAAFDINNEHALAIKNVVYWPRLDPNQQPNTNPTLAGILLYQHRDKDTGDPVDPWPDQNPTLSISAGDKLFVAPDYLPGPGYAGAADQNYLLRVNNTATDPDTVDTKVVERELIRFQFYATAGTFSPEQQQSEVDPILAPGTRLHTDSEYGLPKASELPPDGKVTIWVITHDERAGSDWMSTTITVVP